MVKSGHYLMNLARMACDAVAVGPYTPVVFERWNYIGGQTGVAIGYPGFTADGRKMINWKGFA